MPRFTSNRKFSSQLKYRENIERQNYIPDPAVQIYANQFDQLLEEVPIENVEQNISQNIFEDDDDWFFNLIADSSVNLELAHENNDATIQMDANQFDQLLEEVPIKNVEQQVSQSIFEENNHLFFNIIDNDLVNLEIAQENNYPFSHDMELDFPNPFIGPQPMHDERVLNLHNSFLAGLDKIKKTNLTTLQ